MSESVEEMNAVEALAAIDRTRAHMVEKISHLGWRYDLTYAVLTMVAVAGQGLPVPLVFAADAVSVIGLVLLMRWWVARTGIWVSGIAPTRARWIAFGIAGVYGAGAVIGAWQARQDHGWIVLPLAGVVGVVALAGSRLWRRVYLREIEAGVLADPHGPRRLGLRVSSWVFVGAGVACGLAAAVMAIAKVDSYLVGMFTGMAGALTASPILLKFKRRLMGR